MLKEEKAAAIIFLQQHGFEGDGETDIQEIRTWNNNGNCPMLLKLGGRTRMRKPGTDWKVTIGAYSVCFYRVVKGQAVFGIENFSPGNATRLAEVVAQIETLAAADAGKGE